MSSGTEITVSPVPFHAGTAGEIRYEVIETHILARIRVDIGNGATLETAPAPSSGTVDAVYITAGTFTVTITATLITGTVLQAVATINVVS